jgi:hypothetical protein
MKEGESRVPDLCGSLSATACAVRLSTHGKVVPRAFKMQNRGSGRDQLQRRFNLLGRCKWIARAVHKERRCAQGREVRGARRIGLVRRMKRVGQQHETVHNLRVLGCQHACLPSAVRVTAEENSRVLRRYLFDRLDGVSQPVAVRGGVSAIRRTVGPLLAVWQIAAQHDESGFGEGASQCHQQRRLAVRSGSVRQHQRLAGGYHRGMDEPLNRWSSIGREGRDHGEISACQYSRCRYFSFSKRLKNRRNLAYRNTDKPKRTLYVATEAARAQY